MLWICALEYAYIPAPPLLAYQNIISLKALAASFSLLRLRSFRQGRWSPEERKTKAAEIAKMVNG